MKVILTGSTGLVGGGVLQRCLSDSAITSIVALTRRELKVKHEKLHVIIHKDFLTYPPELLSQLEGAEACIWALGAPRAGPEVHKDFTMAAAQAFQTYIADKMASTRGLKFRFVYVSGALVERDRSKSLWFLSEMRKMRGDVENMVIELNQQSQGSWKSVVVRPAAITKGDPIFVRMFLPWLYISVETLAAALVDVAVTGESETIIENGDLRTRGSAVLQSDAPQ